MIKPDTGQRPKRGAPFGNRNALKTGRHTADLLDLRKRIAAWRRQLRAMKSLLAEMEQAGPLPSRFRPRSSGIIWAKRYDAE